MAKRNCDECQACCTTIAVHDIGKPNHTRCPSQCAAGCAVYASRPQSCRVYKCSWLQGYGKDEDRPDKSGVLMETMSAHRQGRPVFHVVFAMSTTKEPLRPDAVRRIASNVVKDSVCLVLLADSGVTIFAADEDEETATQAVAAFFTQPIHMADGVFELSKIVTH